MILKGLSNNKFVLYDINLLDIAISVSMQIIPNEDYAMCLLLTILSLFSKNRNVLNSSLMELFTKDDKTKDYAGKRKNKALATLDSKLVKLFKINFIKKEKSKGDSRQLTYTLNKKIRIIEETNE